jgi:hypothetical protein
VTALFNKVTAPFAAVATWWAANVAALVADDESLPHAAPSPMWWGELLNPPLED